MSTLKVSPKTLPKKATIITKEDLKKVDWVQNVSGTKLLIPLSDGKQNVVIDKDEVFQLGSYFDEAERSKCRPLHNAINGIDFTGSKGGGNRKPLLRILIGQDDPAIISTGYKSQRFAKVEGTQMDSDKNIYDVKLMELKLKELDDAIESMPDDEEKEMKIMMRDQYKKKINKMEKEVKEDSKLIVIVTGGAESASASAEGKEEIEEEEENF